MINKPSPRSTRHAEDPTSYAQTTTGDPVSIDYLAKLLTPAGVNAQVLRATRLAQLVTVIAPVLVAAAFGIRRSAALHYLADTVDNQTANRYR